jgi:hypothetical protein
LRRNTSKNAGVPKAPRQRSQLGSQR